MRILFHDHFYSPSKCEATERGSGACRNRPILSSAFDGSKQRTSVTTPTVRQHPNHPRVAAFLGCGTQHITGPPSDRIPPVHDNHHKLKPPDPMIAAPKMRKLVEQNRTARVAVERFEQLARQQNHRSPTNR